MFETSYTLTVGIYPAISRDRESNVPEKDSAKLGLKIIVLGEKKFIWDEKPRMTRDRKGHNIRN